MTRHEFKFWLKSQFDRIMEAVAVIQQEWR